MKKNIFKRAVSMVLTLVLMLGMVVAGTGQARAESVKGELSICSPLHAGEDFEITVRNPDTQEEATITYAKSSDRKVAKITEDSGYYTVYAKKPGKTRITVKYKWDNGETGKIAKNFRVKKYPNQIKSLKVNGKSIKTTGEERYWYSELCYKTYAKIQLSLRKGWKIAKVEGAYYDSKDDRYRNIKNVKKLVKAGKSIRFPKKYRYMDIKIEMKKGTEAISYQIRLFR